MPTAAAELHLTFGQLFHLKSQSQTPQGDMGLKKQRMQGTRSKSLPGGSVFPSDTKPKRPACPDSAGITS